MEIEPTKIRQQITAYGLFDTLMDRMKIVRVGGVKRSTIYKAFNQGPVTTLCQIILETAEKVLAEHLATLSEPVAA